MGEAAAQFVLLPIGLGLFGFVEPCSIGAHLLFLRILDGRSRRVKIVQVAVFAAVRSLFMGALGALAALAGAAALGVQRAGWAALGALYVAIGLLYVTGRIGAVMRAFGPRLPDAAQPRAAAGLGLLFGLNVPACSAPLLAVLLGGAAAGGAGPLLGFASLALFGLGLSLPLLAVVLWPRGRVLVDRLAVLGARLPVWVGLLFLLLGAWSLYSAFAARP